VGTCDLRSLGNWPRSDSGADRWDQMVMEGLTLPSQWVVLKLSGSVASPEVDPVPAMGLDGVAHLLGVGHSHAPVMVESVGMLLRSS